MRKFAFIFILLLCMPFSGCEKEIATEPYVSVMKQMPMPPFYIKEELESKIRDITEKSSCDWSVFVEIPNRDFKVVINDKTVRSASVIKMFNMATLYNEEKNGNIEITDKLLGTCYKMITVSSNEDSNKVVKAIGNGDFDLGAKKVTEFANSIGCVSTLEQHPLYDVSGPGHGINTTSVSDCGNFLKKLYKKELVSPEADNKMLEILKKQEINHKLPSKLPEDVTVAHKTGENSRVELDVGIVYSPACDYIICISVTNFRGENIQKTFGEISKTVYNFFNTKTIV